MQVKKYTCFFSFFSVPSQIFLVIRDFVRGSPFSCGQMAKAGKTTGPVTKKHVGIRPPTIMNWATICYICNSVMYITSEIAV